MPHKHVRRKGANETDFNLAPSQVAKPLATRAPKTAAKKVKAKRPKPETGKGYKHDDTPRAFSRMLALQASKKRQRSGLDDGDDTRASRKKQRKAASQGAGTTEVAPTATAQGPSSEVPKILPGERLGDFAARVDHALPVTGLARKGKVQVDGVKERQTKTERRLQKMYASWREDEARLKEKEEERQEEEEEAEEERDAELGGKQAQFPDSNRKSKKRRRMVGEQGGDDDDPWAELAARREQRKGLHDVVQAPPSFKTVPKEKFKVRNNARVDVENVPGTAGSLKRREELGDARREVIERYRAMMGKKKGQ
ncbi:uncharacterized protein LTR77_007537 [Saxophila tyrrhenica]|uniref:Uncharacterized protein n=1 Tax=Saxophila tyrrhenica TaxID=1690608 RepID=A0AAV9P5P7_9PEZI|nr:hypothetical protein LTR77_007537 [Saxophila tyrrhenica]